MCSPSVIGATDLMPAFALKPMSAVAESVSQSLFTCSPAPASGGGIDSAGDETRQAGLAAAGLLLPPPPGTEEMPAGMLAAGGPARLAEAPGHGGISGIGCSAIAALARAVLTLLPAAPAPRELDARMASAASGAGAERGGASGETDSGREHAEQGDNRAVGEMALGRVSAGDGELATASDVEAEVEGGGKECRGSAAGGECRPSGRFPGEGDDGPLARSGVPVGPSSRNIVARTEGRPFAYSSASSGCKGSGEAAGAGGIAVSSGLPPECTATVGAPARVVATAVPLRVAFRPVAVTLAALARNAAIRRGAWSRRSATNVCWLRAGVPVQTSSE